MVDLAEVNLLNNPVQTTDPSVDCIIQHSLSVAR